MKWKKEQKQKDDDIPDDKGSSSGSGVKIEASVHPGSRKPELTGKM